MSHRFPVFFLPPEPGMMTTMANVKNTPWQPDSGFSVWELGQRLRHGRPYAKWLDIMDMELWGVNPPKDWVDGMDGNWYILVRGEERADFEYDPDILNKEDD